MVQVRRGLAKRKSMQEEYTYAEGVWREISTGKMQGEDEGKGPGECGKDIRTGIGILESSQISWRREREGLRE